MQDSHHSEESLRYLRALGDPDRLKIVLALRSGPMSVGEICRALDSPIANVSHHLKTLKDAGIVSASRKGRFVIYRLDHVVDSAHGGTHLLDFGCCRVEFVEGQEISPTATATPPRVEEQALLMLNRILGQAPPAGSPPRRAPKVATRRAGAGSGRSRRVDIANHSFELPATAFFDTAVAGWEKEGDPSGTGVFHNFPDDTPLPGSRQVRNADGAQLATVGARNPGKRAGGASALFQSLHGATYHAGASYVLSVGVGISSVQPPTGGGSPPALRFALTFPDDAGRRKEVIGRSITPADVIAGQPRDGGAAAGKPPDRLVYFSVATTIARSPAAACAGRGIGILITTEENTPAHAGNFILDNVTLVADTPHPTEARAKRVAGAKRRPARRTRAARAGS